MMDITCGDCGARFRLDAALMKGAKGARVRCRRCGGPIVVLLPEDPPVLSVDDLLPMDTEVPSAEPKGVASHAPEEGAAAGEHPQEETAEPEPGRKAPPRRAPSMLKVLVISVLWILLLAGGALYFGTTKSGQDMVGTLFAGFGSTRTGSAPEGPVYDIRDVKWHVDKDSVAGSLFVIRGAVANFGKDPSGGIGIRATLLGKDNEALAEKAAFAGNPLDESSLRQMNRAGIDAAMSNRFGEGNVNKEIAPGKSLPFMVVFFDPPGGIEAVMVTAIDAK